MRASQPMTSAEFSSSVLLKRADGKGTSTITPAVIATLCATTMGSSVIWVGTESRNEFDAPLFGDPPTGEKKVSCENVADWPGATLNSHDRPAPLSNANSSVHAQVSGNGAWLPMRDHTSL